MESLDLLVRAPRDAACAPEPVTLRTRLLGRREQSLRVAAPLVSEEERRGGASPNELDVHVRVCGVDVTEQPTVAIHVVEPSIVLERDARPRPHETGKLARGGHGVALPLPQLGGVDLHEPDARSALEHERVPVGDPLDRRRVAFDGVIRCGTRWSGDEQEKQGGKR